MPAADGVVETAGDEELAIRSPGNRHDVVSVPREFVQRPSGVDVPDTQCRVAVQVTGSGRCPLSIRRQSHAADALGVAVEFADRLSGLSVPQPHRVVPAPREDTTTVR